MKCFVAMPYGKDPQEQKMLTRFYKFIIKSAVEDCGLACIRSDIEAQGGHIMSNVIEALADDDLVIADVSGANWNVAYELGIRHVLRKNGTILICCKDTALPFDIQSMNVYFYDNDWMDKTEEICEDLKKLIQNRLNGITKNDSPIHEKFPFLPDDIIHSYTTSTESGMKEAKARIAELERELSDVYKKVEDMGLSLDSAEQEPEIDYTKQFLEDFRNNIYNSDAAVAKLRELMEQGAKEEFLEFLGKVLRVGYLDEVDCRNVYNLCKKLDTPAICRTFLEAVTKFYPESEELLALLANEYSMNYHTGDKALQMVNSIIGVTKKDGVYQLSKTTTPSVRKLASFFDVYLHLKKETDILAVGKLLCQKYSSNTKILTITTRNMLSAAVTLEMYNEAAGYKGRLLELAPKSALTHYMCRKYECAVENYEGALQEAEESIVCDPKDADYYYVMAAFICDYLHARHPISHEILSISESASDQYVLPFLITAVVRGYNPRSAIDFLRRNNYSSYINSLIEFVQAGGGDYEKFFPGLDFGAVNYCLNRNE